MADLDPFHDFQRAARRLANHIAPGVPMGWVALFDAQRQNIAEVRVPAAACAEAADDHMGWDFSAGVPKFDGEEVPVAGKPLEILKLLAGTDGPMKLREIRRRVWDGANLPDESTVRQHVMDLRDTLAEHFPEWKDEFVRTTPHGYQLLFR